MNALIYTKDNCTFCVQAKHLMASNNVSFKEVKIGSDMVVEDFKSLFPDQRTVPLVFVDGQRIGGFAELKEYFDNKPLLLEE